LDKGNECVFVEVGNDGAYIAMKLFEYMVVIVGQIGQEIFLARNKFKTLHPEHGDHKDKGEIEDCYDCDHFIFQARQNA
jgi:hypothetical protein